MTVRWIVRSDPVGCGQYFWFYVYIYDTAEELRKAATKYSHHNMDFSDTVGCFQPSLSFKIDPKAKKLSDSKWRKRSSKTAFLGVMRLCKTHLQPHIVIHESTHAAVNYVNALRLKSGYMLGNSNLDSEEPLCNAVHEFSTSLLTKLDYLK